MPAPGAAEAVAVMVAPWLAIDQITQRQHRARLALQDRGRRLGTGGASDPEQVVKRLGEQGLLAVGDVARGQNHRRRVVGRRRHDGHPGGHRQAGKRDAQRCHRRRRVRDSGFGCGTVTWAAQVDHRGRGGVVHQFEPIFLAAP